ncbi:hypothetical transposase, putative [Trichonephila inaurata madagascariensis]|uniref:Hypothetical transposase, putative n=1 Tax=Trichonephila inaurata madagascariensis TaxID=2747483 RepID=A0A8X6Y3D0_9ARAC|nr:hypothetical transposase, putative [Trichonephila inaurata madagascariensis]
MKLATTVKVNLVGVGCLPVIQQVYKVDRVKRNEGLQNSKFCNRNSLVVTDRYAAYNYFADKNRQICWAHLSRDFERLVHSWNIEVKVLGCYLRT